MAALSKRQVLLVDDDPAIRACIAMLLEAHGYDVAAAEDGLEALLLLSRHVQVGDEVSFSCLKSAVVFRRL